MHQLMTTTWSWQMICQRVGGLTCRTEQNSKQVDIGQSGVLHEITRDVNEVFHQAAVVIVQRSVNDPLACHEVNTHATLRLLELVREREFRVVPVLNAAICRHLGSLPLAKPESRAPTSPYGIYTHSRSLRRLYHELYNVVALRYFSLFDPRQRAGDYAVIITFF